MRKAITKEMDQLDSQYQSEVQALRYENDVICGAGEHLYTVRNVSLLKKKIKQNEKIPENKNFKEKVE